MKDIFMIVSLVCFCVRGVMASITSVYQRTSGRTEYCMESGTPPTFTRLIYEVRGGWYVFCRDKTD